MPYSFSIYAKIIQYLLQSIVLQSVSVILTRLGHCYNCSLLDSFIHNYAILPEGLRSFDLYLLYLFT